MRQRIAQDVYDRIDNGIYDSEQERWWEPDSALYLIKGSLNPARLGFVKRVLEQELRWSPPGRSALEVGCGGGILTEEIARLGFSTSGVDPAERSLRIAAEHAAQSGLAISYRQGSGEALPYPDARFDAVFCCDVLEHVRDLPRVVQEISRVLRPGGIFFYDTINRSWASRLVAINLAQRWPRWAFLPEGLHVWEMFIKPAEMKSLLAASGLTWREHRGLRPNASPLTVLRCLRQRARGELDFSEFGRRLSLVECGTTGLMYLGYAVKA
ncbi:ubiquinone biosynthesis O-methyltransferase [Geomonas silvestris]|uniref:Ubiquinone biosynthesis O-methyltransferase n=1 Tax=Geomonas silvestris TaxID=2740184 RepID=A0A6V8MDD4_9BACT|nr:bifunctional 2-polyprenyl-6-hydroxyphenol methylase/3-demethylubiquinol 3-O-methyltransferase UbiG [Geomonas silvestris]GFO58008.1 ubiquinone biosynthesis O-methyltransferase [Geomonas silvestris]